MLKRMAHMQKLMRQQEDKIARMEAKRLSSPARASPAEAAGGLAGSALKRRIEEERAVAEGAMQAQMQARMEAQMAAMQSRFSEMLSQKEEQLKLLQDAAAVRKKALEDPEGRISLMKIEDQMECRMDCLRNEVEQLYSLSRDVRSQIVDLNGALRVVTRCRPMLKRDEGDVVVDCKRDVLYLGKDRLKDPPQGFRFNAVLGASFAVFLALVCPSFASLPLLTAASTPRRPPTRLDVSSRRLLSRAHAGPNTSQKDLFNSVKDIALSVLDMNNVCIFAYGSTGSGKTFSMQGPPGVLDGTASPAGPLFSSFYFILVGIYSFVCSLFFCCSCRVRSIPPHSRRNV
jgi:hypothetical protein